MDDHEDVAEVMELIQSKGGDLDSFKTEFTEVIDVIEKLSATNIGFEREVDYQTGELKSLKEQVAFTRRNIEELVSQQDVLKETIDHLNHKRESLVEREAQNREEITVFSGYFNELKEALSVGGDWRPEQVEQRITLEKERDFASSKLENKTNQLHGMRSEIDHAYETIKLLEEQISALDTELEAADTHRTDLKGQATKLLAKKEELERTVHDLQAEILDRQNEIDERHRAKTAEDRSLRLLESSIAKSKSQMEIFLSNYDQLYRKLQESTAELERQNTLNDRIREELKEKEANVDNMKGEAKKLTKAIAQLNQLRQMTVQRGIEVEEEKGASEQKIEGINRNIASIRGSTMLGVSKDIDAQEKQLSSLRQELAILRKKTAGSERTSKAMTDLIQLNKNGKLNMSIEVKILEEEVQHYKVQIRAQLTEKDKFEHDAEVANQQYYTALEEMKLQELQVQELNKKIAADQTKLKQKQSLYESVRSDRNLYSKQLVDSQDEINELKRKFRSMNHQIEQMKEEISSKDHAIVKEHFLHHSVDKERELLKNELTKIRKQVQSSEVIIENQRVEIMKLQRIIEEADQEAQRQKNELTAVMSERNLLTSQLVKRTAELTDMYHRIKVQRANLRIGERNYDRYHDWMAELRGQVIETVGKHNEVVQGLAQLDEVRFQVTRLERDLLREKTKSRALLDELETPMNVHRWRILESSDPKRFEKITQIQTLQKQLVSMSDKVVQTDLLVQEKEKVYVELKNVISRHPGPEVEEQILVYQQTLKDKTTQLAAMDQELEMYMEQVAKFKEEIAEVDARSHKLNKKWMRTIKKQRASKSGGGSLLGQSQQSLGLSQSYGGGGGGGGGGTGMGISGFQ